MCLSSIDPVQYKAIICQINSAVLLTYKFYLAMHVCPQAPRSFSMHTRALKIAREPKDKATIIIEGVYS